MNPNFFLSDADNPFYQFNTVDDVSDHSEDVSKDEQIAALAEAAKANGVSGGSDGAVTGRGEMASGVQNANTGDSGGRSGGI